MNHMIDPVLSKAPAAFRWLPATDPKHDARDVLAEALGPMWSVHCEADCEGEVSIVVLPDDDEIGPAFLLYEKGGLAWVGTVSGDEWTSRESFSGIQAAATAIIVKTASVAVARPTGA
nr:hypothetical protein [uncultured Rhodopila sp.]